MWNLKVQFRIYKRPPLVPVLIKMVYTLYTPSHFIQVCAAKRRFGQLRISYTTVVP